MSDRPPRLYSLCGLRIRSELDLALAHAAGDEWDVDVRWGPDIADLREPLTGEVIAACETEHGHWYSATSSGSGIHLRFSDCGEFVVSEDLSEVVVRRTQSEQAAILPVLMAGTVLAFLLALRGETVLHASAVAVDGRALVFSGHSGRGKSTVAAMLCVEGFELVTDDVLTINVGPPVTCLGGASELRLRAAAAAIVEGRPEHTTRGTIDERLAYAPRAAPLGPLPVAAIVIPGPSRTASEIDVELVSPSTAVFALLSFPRIYGWKRSDIISRDFKTIGEIVNTVPVYNVTIPWGPPFDPSIASALAELAVG